MNEDNNWPGLSDLGNPCKKPLYRFRFKTGRCMNRKTSADSDHLNRAYLSQAINDLHRGMRSDKWITAAKNYIINFRVSDNVCQTTFNVFVGQVTFGTANLTSPGAKLVWHT